MISVPEDISDHWLAAKIIANKVAAKQNELDQTHEPSTVCKNGRRRSSDKVHMRNSVHQFKPSAALFLVVGASAPALGAQFYASQVIDTVVGAGQPIAFSDPTQALGGPTGAGSNEGSVDVYKLGSGGSITLGFSGGAINDGPGPDFIVYANPFYVSNNPGTDFAELSFVEVSSDNIHYVRFPDSSSTTTDPGPFGSINPNNISGFAGVTPVYANTSPSNGINPFNAATAGGDAFDLSTLAALPAAQTLVHQGYLNLDDIQYVRIVDVIDGVSVDSNGNTIYCPGSGADVDAVAVINGVTPEPSLTWNNTGASPPADGVTWDTTNNNWNNGTSATTYADGALVTFNDNNNGNYAVTLNSTVSPGSVTVSNSSGNYTISGAGSIAGTGSLTKMGSSTLTLNTLNTYSGGTTVSGGTLVIGVNGALPSHSLAITGGIVQLAASTGLAQITSLSISAGAALDITNNHMIITYAPGMQAAVDAAIRGYLIAGRNGGAWNGTGGIDSSIAALPVNSHYGIGYADGADGVVVGLSSGQIEIKYTLLGDADLDGAVTGSDFTALVGNLGKSGRTWDQGDFDYDGSVTGSDFTALVGNLGKSASGADVILAAADYAAIDAFAAANGLMADVPEPASFTLLGLAAAALLAPRRRPA
jgi:autotransporter-associated beta strand protein